MTNLVNDSGDVACQSSPALTNVLVQLLFLVYGDIDMDGQFCNTLLVLFSVDAGVLA